MTIVRLTKREKDEMRRRTWRQREGEGRYQVNKMDFQK